MNVAHPKAHLYSSNLKEIRVPEELLQRSTFWIVAYAAKPFILIMLAMLAGLMIGPLWVAVPVAALLLLAAQRHFQTLIHDAAHYFYSRNPSRNDTLTNWLAAGWIGMEVARYRKIHMKHHAHNGSKDDPEHVSFATVSADGGLAWMIARYILGLESVRLFLKYFAKSDAPAKKSDTPAKKQGGSSGKLWSMKHIFACQLVLATVMVVSGLWWEYAAWLYLAVTWNPLLSRLRFMAEHPGEDDMTVTTLATVLENTYFAPQSFNYHLEHHGWPMVPPYRLSKMHRFLREEVRFYDDRGELLSPSYIGKLLELSHDRNEPKGIKI
ncbi:fatty acid desaturase [Mesorhizobium newzealandense]|uniref:Fatty acid desaturase n=1 Tax=Mesorhizobium newzealandense TaxID=1300302 RepID=A0ABW4UKE9_9HYPH